MGRPSPTAQTIEHKGKCSSIPVEVYPQGYIGNYIQARGVWHGVPMGDIHSLAGAGR